MANASFYEGYDDVAYDLDTVNTEDPTIASTTTDESDDIYDEAIRMSLNNWPLCAEDPECINADDPTVIIDPTIPQDDIGCCDLTTRTYGVTFESIRQNIASYNYNTDLNDIKHLIRTYYLEDNKTITQEVDMRTPGIIYTKLSGDTGFGDVLVKTTQYTDNRMFNTVYGVE